MRILIVEDVITQLNLISQSLLNKYPDIDICVANDYDTAVKYINDYNFQIFIFDIDLGEGNAKNGIALAKYVRTLSGYSITPILFLTSIPTQVTTAINETHCYSYLLKPYSEEELISSLKSLMTTPLIPIAPLEIKGTNGLYFHLAPSEIIYLETYGHSLNIYTDLNTFQTKSYSIRDLCAKLSNYIIQIHKSYAVNPAKIISTDKNKVCLKLGIDIISLPVGRMYKDIVSRRF